MKLLIIGVLGILLLPEVAWSQSAIVPDDTLGAERSEVIQNVQGLAIEEIRGGAQRGQNLFHSFQEFNVSEGRGAYFSIPNSAVQNVLTRITGSNASRILGTLGTVSSEGVRVPNVNLFLINPNGIVFGENASLDVGASFNATTASAIQLGDGIFSAAQPEQPIDLLTIAPSVFLFGSAAPGRIEVRSRNTQANFSNQTLGLQVPNGKTLFLLGGAVMIDGGRLNAHGGQVEIGAVGADVTFTNASQVDVSLDQGGEVFITARNIGLSNSRIKAGIDAGLGATGNQAGDIRLNATGEVRLEQGSQIANSVFQDAIGNGGNIIINADSLLVTSGSQLTANTFGTGDTGDIAITVNGATIFDGVGSSENSSAVGSRVELNAVGNGGMLALTTGSLSVTSGGFLSSSTFGQGDAGDITIIVRDTATFDGVGSNGSSSAALTTVNPDAAGNGGTLTLSAGSLSVTDGAQLTANTAGQGNAGNVVITVRDAATFDAMGKNRSGAGSQVNPGAVGNGGTLNLSAGSLSVNNGAFLSASTFGRGDAGSVTITVRDAITFDGVGNNGNPSNAGSTVELNAVGNGGTLNLSAGSLSVTNGAFLSSSTSGQGDAGNVQLIASDRILFENSSGAFSSVEASGVGKGGNVVIDAPLVEVRDGAQISSSLNGEGDAGNILVTARERVLFQNLGTAFSNVEASGVGKGGNIMIDAPLVEVRDGAQLNASVRGNGDAGSVLITARESVLFENSSGAFSNVAASGVGEGGNIVIETPILEVLDGAQLISATLGIGDAGDIQIRGGNSVLFQNSFAFSSVAAGGEGKGGNIVIDAPLLKVLDGALLVASTDGKGDAGNILITAGDSALFENRGAAIARVEAGGEGNGGNVVIEAPLLEVRDGAGLSAATSGKGDAGNVLITASDRVLLNGTNPTDGRSSGIFTSNGTSTSSARTGTGGNISISAPQLQVSNGAVIDASTVNDQPGGDITLTLGQLTLLSGGQILTTSDSSGQAGTVSMNATDGIRIFGTDPTHAARRAAFGIAVAPVTENSGIYIRSTANGPAGNLILNSPQLRLSDNSQIIADSDAATGGNLNFTLKQALLLEGNSLISATAGRNEGGGDGGNVTITSPFLIGFPGNNSDIIANAFRGTGGSITINANAILNFQQASEPDVETLRSNSTNDVSASSQFGGSGTLNLAGLNVDPAQGITQLPTNLLTPADQVSRRCAADRIANTTQSEFFITGRSGLPSRPGDAPTSRYSTGTIATTSDASDLTDASTTLPSTTLTEAASWQRDPQGNIQLIASSHPLEVDHKVHCNQPLSHRDSHQ